MLQLSIDVDILAVAVLFQLEHLIFSVSDMSVLINFITRATLC